MSKTLVWYHKELDRIFESAWLDAMFCGLRTGVDWCKVELLGEL